MPVLAELAPSQMAPESPTTDELHTQYQPSDRAEVEIPLLRERTNGILSGREEGTTGDAGVCSLNVAESATITREGEITRDVTAETKGLIVAHRVPPWKPRTNKEDWHGAETTHPDEAFQHIRNEANLGIGVSIEMAMPYHPDRYMDSVIKSWIGGRHIGDKELMDHVAMHSPDVALAIKNGLDGNIHAALGHALRLNQMRQDAVGENAAPVVLLYRGGENATDPESWEREYRKALELTNGLMIVDAAHGAEMAHDPNGNFKKSVAGQIRAMEHVIQIAERYGESPAGMMLEASDTVSLTDPHMPFDVAMDGLKRLHAVRYAISV